MTNILFNFPATWERNISCPHKPRGTNSGVSEMLQFCSWKTASASVGSRACGGTSCPEFHYGLLSQPDPSPFFSIDHQLGGTADSAERPDRP